MKNLPDADNWPHFQKIVKNKNASWSKSKSESAIFNNFLYCTGLWRILGANWNSWRRGGGIWQTLIILNWIWQNLIILNWNGFLLLLVGSSWSATQVFRWTVPTAELWKMKLYICILIFPRQASLILWFISSKNETNYYKTFWNLIYPARSQPTME